MVLRIAFRTLQSEHDAEDVFQATFLVLSQKAHSLRRQASLGGWLYRIAYRLALKAKTTAGQRRNREKCVAATPVPTPLAQITVQEAQTILDEELNRLPKKLRDPVVLCCLEGLARDEAAQQIGCPAGVLKSRLEQARERLRQRLVARGLTLPCGLGAFLLLEGAAGASVPPALTGSTTNAAITIAAGKAVKTVVTAKVAALTEGVLRTMFLTKIKIAAVALAVGVTVLGGGMLTHRLPAHGDQLPSAAAQPAAPQKLELKREKEAFTAWGKEVGGLQAGLGYLPGQKRAYTHGETVTLVLRVRNVGKEAVKWSYLQPFIEHAPMVTDGDGKPVPQPTKLYEIGARLPGEVELSPGKEIEIHELKRELRPASESGSKQYRPDGRLHALYGTGQVSVRYEQVLGDPSMGYPGWQLDAILSKLATGKLEVDIKSDPAQPEKKAQEKQEQKPKAGIDKVRDAAAIEQSANNLKEIGLAIHNFHGHAKSLPAHAIYSKDGKTPLLSWRVAILPHIEQTKLYEAFKLDEPWDSAHNEKLIPKMPKIYAMPGAANAKEGETHYQVVIGPETLFVGAKKMKFEDITDGTSNTLLVAEAKAPVVWTRPGDLQLPKDKDTRLPVGGLFANGFNVLLCDASVRLLPQDVPVATLRALVTPAARD
jgi:RNA polymerase sigma factor (sigma-70 family)